MYGIKFKDKDGELVHQVGVDGRILIYSSISPLGRFERVELVSFVPLSKLARGMQVAALPYLVSEFNDLEEIAKSAVSMQAREGDMMLVRCYDSGGNGKLTVFGPVISVEDLVQKSTA